jgi:Fuc2NAc and GlcNAc transferase
VIITVAAFLAAVLTTALVWRYLVSRKVLDVPNERSSHSAPTPRGGGISIVLVFLVAIQWFVYRGTLPASLGWALTGSGLAVALAGFLDDRFDLPSRWRLAIHFAAAAFALWQIDGMAPLQLGWTVWNWGWAGHVVALIGVVWMINLYNFMDGIDGIAGIEALCAGGSGALLLAWSGVAGLAQSSAVLAAASAGFLVFNWPPAKVFMGDAGSGFLGFAFAMLAIASAKEKPWLLWPWLILLAVFIVDSMVTLVRRYRAGARWYAAHCSHAYQHSARHRGHLKTTLAVAAINLVWLFPLAWAACVWPSAGPLFTALAVAPLIYTAVRCRAGQETPVAQTAVRA